MKKNVSNLSEVDDTELWHERLSQSNFTDVKNTDPRVLHCAKDVREICVLCKIMKVSVPKETEVKSTKPLEKVFNDILRPLNPPSVRRFRYVLMIVDEYNKFKVVKFPRA